MQNTYLSTIVYNIQVKKGGEGTPGSYDILSYHVRYRINLYRPWVYNMSFSNTLPFEFHFLPNKCNFFFHAWDIVGEVCGRRFQHNSINFTCLEMKLHMVFSVSDIPPLLNYIYIIYIYKHTIYIHSPPGLSIA